MAINGYKFCYFVVLWQIFHICAEKTALKVNTSRAEIKLFEFDVNENLHRYTQQSDRVQQLKAFRQLYREYRHIILQAQC